MALFIPTYFSPISQYAAIVNSSNVLFEVEDNYQKQTYRNRCYIYGANGKQLLNIPIKHLHTEGRKKTKDALIENDFPWQDQHFKSLRTAYKNSPFFEFFEDDLLKIFTKKYTYLLDVNIDSFLFLTDAIQIKSTYLKTSEYSLDSNVNDYRYLANVKKEKPIIIDTYIQMFDDKYGFLSNLSMLDLLFMEGPNSISFLEKIELTLE